MTYWDKNATVCVFVSYLYHKQGEQYYTSGEFVPNIRSAHVILNNSLVNKEVNIVLYFKPNIMFLLNLAENILPVKPQQNYRVSLSNTALFSF